MAAVTSAPYVTWCICIWIFPLAAMSELQTVKAKPGGECVMICQSPQKAPVQLLEWSKADLKSDDFVFVYRRDSSYDISLLQLPSFKNRVELTDPEMKDGNVSVILKNVTKNDNGTYKCYVSVSKTTSRHKRASPDFSTNIMLVVEDSGGDKDGGDKDGGNDGEVEMRGHVGLIATVLLFVAVFIGVWIFSRPKRHMKKSSSPPPPDEAGLHQLL